MKKMILMVAFSICSFGVVLIAQAAPNEQHQRTPEERATERSEHMAKKLGLDEQQKQQVYKLILESIKEMDVQREAMQQSREQFQKQRKEFIEGQQEKLRGIFSEEQYHQFELDRERKIGQRQGRRQMQKQMQHGRGPGQGRPKGPPPKEMNMDDAR